MKKHNIPFQIEVLYNNIISNNIYLIKNEYYNIYTYGESREEAIQKFNQCFNVFLNYYLNIHDYELTSETMELKQRYIDYYMSINNPYIKKKKDN